MLSHKFTTATPWLRDASAYTRIVFTIQVDVERQGTHIRRTMRVVNEVHEIALVPNQLGETSDRDGDQDAALGFFEKLPIGAAGSTSQDADKVANDQEGGSNRAEDQNVPFRAVNENGASDTAAMSLGTVAGVVVGSEDGVSDTATMSSNTIAGDEDGASDTATMSSGTIAGVVVGSEDGASDTATMSSGTIADNHASDNDGASDSEA